MTHLADSCAREPDPRSSRQRDVEDAVEQLAMDVGDTPTRRGTA